MTVLFYVFVTYLVVCWLWGLYLAIRLYTGRRLSRLMRGRGVKVRAIHPLTHDTSTAPTRAAAARTAEAIAESRAA